MLFGYRQIRTARVRNNFLFRFPYVAYEKGYAGKHGMVDVVTVAHNHRALAVVLYKHYDSARNQVIALRTLVLVFRRYIRFRILRQGRDVRLRNILQLLHSVFLPVRRAFLYLSKRRARRGDFEGGLSDPGIRLRIIIFFERCILL